MWLAGQVPHAGLMIAPAAAHRQAHLATSGTAIHAQE